MNKPRDDYDAVIIDQFLDALDAAYDNSEIATEMEIETDRGPIRVFVVRDGSAPEGTRFN